jgi:nucleotide-binding universal stress UspA family protein
VSERVGSTPGCCAEGVSSKIIGRVVVGVDCSPGSLAALRYALDQARRLDATLVPVHAWQVPGGELPSRRAADPGYTRMVREMAEQELRRAFDEGLGGLPRDVPAEPRLIRGAVGPALVETADRASDLLVIGAGRRGRLHHPMHAKTARYCLAHAVCPVIAVPPPTLQAELSSPHRLRVNTDRLARELTTTRAH